MDTVARWTVYETRFESDRDYGAGSTQVRLTVRAQSPAGEEQAVEAFWDGGRTWRCRICPDVVGQWRYRTECSDASNAGLHGREGGFVCTAYEGDNPLYRHGQLRVAAEGYHLEHADGTPFLWLGDTGWNGVLRAKEADWRRYLARRREQGFTGTQHVMTHWRALPRDAAGETACRDGQPIRVNPAFFQRLDAKVAAVNEAGLVSAPVLLWAIAGEHNPGHTLAEEGAVTLARYMVARYGAHHVVWFLGGDGDYRGERADRWRRIGRAVFDGPRRRPVTMHPGGLHWVGDEFRGEPWYDFIGYQSGHGDGDDHVRWLVQGPPATEWAKEPALPLINLEPNYEGHVSYHSRRVFGAYEVRRALYWSLLVSPTAGVTYGHHGIWPWMEERAVPIDHPQSGEAPPWWEALEAPGAAAIRPLRALLESLPWWQLRPAQHILARQPGDADANLFVAAAMTAEGGAGLVYVPRGAVLALRPGVLKLPAALTWHDPASGRAVDAGRLTEGAGGEQAPPDGGDWVLQMRAG